MALASGITKQVVLFFSSCTSYLKSNISVEGYTSIIETRTTHKYL